VNKSEFVSLLSKRLGISKNSVQKYFLESRNLLIEVINKGVQVKIANFGKFCCEETKERLCLNPITKRYFYLEKKKQIAFKPYKKFKFSIK